MFTESIKYYALTAFFFLLTAALASCAHQKPEEGGEPLYLKAAGNAAKDSMAVFENELVKVSVLPLNTCCDGKYAPLNELFKRNYVFFKMDIENKTQTFVVYNPSHTSLFTGAMDYKKPIDYTDLYHEAAEFSKGTQPEKWLASLKGLYYDANTTVLPGKTESRLLIFRPLDKAAKGDTAVLRINELYAGTAATGITLLFRVK